eukprot:Nk52_evm15s2612 gene=Nk52_evmTU15s2612
MAVITDELLAKHSKLTRRKSKTETREQFVSRLTHISLPDCDIEEIENLDKCQELRVIYLYDNRITAIQGLSHGQLASTLTHLYLQNNNIERIENLNHLEALQKLYLSGNRITVLEGLSNCAALSELYVENQKLPEGEKMVFDPDTMAGLGHSLEILNISGNGIEDLDDLAPLQNVEFVYAGRNNIQLARGLATFLNECKSLRVVVFKGNPVCKVLKYRERVIVMANPHLESIDDKDIGPNERTFLINWKESRTGSLTASNCPEKARNQPATTGNYMKRIAALQEKAHSLQDSGAMAPIWLQSVAQQSSGRAMRPGDNLVSSFANIASDKIYQQFSKGGGRTGGGMMGANSSRRSGNGSSCGSDMSPFAPRIGRTGMLPLPPAHGNRWVAAGFQNPNAVHHSSLTSTLVPPQLSTLSAGRKQPGANSNHNPFFDNSYFGPSLSSETGTKTKNPSHGRRRRPRHSNHYGPITTTLANVSSHSKPSTENIELEVSRILPQKYPWADHSAATT